MTITEIAKLAGVSNAAVSRYLNNGYLSDEKREVIARVIEETGYRPSVQAQILRTGKTKTIGIILPKIDSYSVSNVVAGIVTVLEEKGYQTLLADTFNNPEKELSYLTTFDEQRVDGVILVGTVLTARHIRALKNSKIPIVVVGQELNGVPCVYHDDYNGFVEITNLVLRKGCRRIGFLSALMEDKAAGSERYRAFCDAVRQAGLPELAKQVVISDFTIDSAEEKTKELWERFGPLDAIVCSTGRMAVGALQFLRSIGKRVPQDVLLTGQGDTTICRVSSPSITNLCYSYEESGAIAAEMMMEKLDNPDCISKHTKLGYTLAERESTQKSAAAL